MKRLVLGLFIVLAAAGAGVLGFRVWQAWPTATEESFDPQGILSRWAPIYQVTDDPTLVEVYLAGRKFAFPRNMIIRMPDRETALNPKAYNSVTMRLVLPDFEGLNAKTKDCYMKKPKECIDVVHMFLDGPTSKFNSPERIYNVYLKETKSWKKNRARKNRYDQTVYQSVGDGTDWLHVGYMPDGELVMWDCAQWLPKIQPDEYSLCQIKTGFIDKKIQFSYQIFYKHLPDWQNIHSGVRKMILSYEQSVPAANDNQEGRP
ncbi:MAG: hypothetical protein M3O22_08955 [Pseudomonadota bacterium]|nr:hypothetical protein [Pseudomonadota bacterium]